MIRGHYRADCSLMFRLSKPRTEFFGHANLDSQMIPDSQQERQVAHMSSELATIRELSRSDSNRMLSTGTSTGSSPVIRSGGSGSLTTRSTVATDPLVHASTRPNSPRRPTGADVITWSLSLRLLPSPPAIRRSRRRAQTTGRHSLKLPGAWRRRRSRSGRWGILPCSRA